MPPFNYIEVHDFPDGVILERVFESLFQVRDTEIREFCILHVGMLLDQGQQQEEVAPL